jgi:hypothetical protein
MQEERRQGSLICESGQSAIVGAVAASTRILHGSCADARQSPFTGFKSVAAPAPNDRRRPVCAAWRGHGGRNDPTLSVSSSGLIWADESSGRYPMEKERHFSRGSHRLTPIAHEITRRVVVSFLQTPRPLCRNFLIDRAA